MAGNVSPARSLGWLLENGPRELESLFRAVVLHASTPILLTDDERNNRDASIGAGNMLRVARDEIIGRRLDDFADVEFQQPISESWTEFLNSGEHAGTLRLSGPSGMLWDVEYTAKGNVLPVRHVVVLRERTTLRDAADDQQPSSRRGARRQNQARESAPGQQAEVSSVRSDRAL